MRTFPRNLAPPRHRFRIGPLPLAGAILIILLANLRAGDGPLRGLPEIRGFPSSAYGASPQNWAVCPSDDGLLWFGNNLGILSWDGTRWRLHKTGQTTSTVVRSLAIGPGNRVFFGAQGEFGYLAPDSSGRLSAINLADQLPPDAPEFGDVWQTHAVGGRIFFRSSEALFAWDGDTVRVWRPATRFHTAFAVNGTLFVREREVGLMRMVGDSLRLIPGGNRFAASSVYAMIPGDGERIRIGTARDGFFLYDGTSVTPLPLTATPLITASQLYCGTRLTDGRIALGTRRNGLIVLSPDGSPELILNSTSGLPDNFVLNMAEDGEGGLWLAMNDGIVRVALGLPLTRLGRDDGLAGAVLDVLPRDDRCYIATSNGLLMLKPPAFRDPPPSADGVPRLTPVTGITRTITDLIDIDDQILASGSEGLFRIEGATAHSIPEAGQGLTRMEPSRTVPGRIYIGQRKGVGVFSMQGTRLMALGDLPAIDEEIHTLAEAHDGTLWLGTTFQGALRVADAHRWPVGPPTVTRYPAPSGRAEDGDVKVNRVGERIFFGTNRGLRRFDPATDRFLPDSLFGTAFADTGNWVFRVVGDGQRRYWLKAGVAGPANVAMVRLNEDGPAGSDSLFRLAGDPGTVHALVPTGEGAVWIGGTGILLHRSPGPIPERAAPLPPLLRGIVANGDSLIHGGGDGAFTLRPSLPSTIRSLRFEAALPNYYAPSLTRYRYRLEGLDEGWSAWTPEPWKDYTHLPPGDFRFHVEARPAIGAATRSAPLAFTLLPPWYRSGWAWTLYILSALALLGAIGNRLVDRQKRKGREVLERERERAALREARLREAAALAKADLEKEQVRGRIARDLHDDLSASLSSIAYFAEAIRRESPRLPDTQRRFLDLIADVSGDAQEAIQDIIWSVQAEHDRLDNLIVKCRRYAADRFDSAAIASTLIIPDDLPVREVDMTVRRHLWLMVKELVSNVVRHSGADHADMGIALEGDRLVVTIRDNGRGFDPEAVEDGNGLGNIRDRAAAIGATAELETRPGAGTRWRIVAPLDIPSPEQTA